LDELVHRYGLPHYIITDLDSNFNNHQFWEYCENSGIDIWHVSVAHPQANGQVERADGEDHVWFEDRTMVASWCDE
jgi:hypothetical protein